MEHTTYLCSSETGNLSYCCWSPLHPTIKPNTVTNTDTHSYATSQKRINGGNASFLRAKIFRRPITVKRKADPIDILQISTSSACMSLVNHLQRLFITFYTTYSLKLGKKSLLSSLISMSQSAYKRCLPFDSLSLRSSVMSTQKNWLQLNFMCLNEKSYRSSSLVTFLLVPIASFLSFFNSFFQYFQCIVPCLLDCSAQKFAKSLSLLYFIFMMSVSKWCKLKPHYLPSRFSSPFANSISILTLFSFLIFFISLLHSSDAVAIQQPGPPQTAKWIYSDSRPSSHNNGLNAPYNISVVLSSWNPPAVTVHWNFRHLNGQAPTRADLRRTELGDRVAIDDRNSVSAFRISYSPYNTRYRYIQEVPAYLNSTNIDNLQPNTKYTLTVSAISHPEDSGNSSHPVIFVSPSAEASERTYSSFSSSRVRLDTEESATMKPAELFVVVLVLLAWVGVIRLFIKKWGKIRTLEPHQNRAARTSQTGVSKVDLRSGSGTVILPTTAAGTAVVHAGSVCGALAAPCKSRLQSFANIASIPKLQMSESQDSLFSSSWAGGVGSGQMPSCRPRINSVFLTSPSRRPSFMQFENNSAPRRYKSAEDLQSVVMQVTERQREQRKLSNCSIKGIDELPKTGTRLSAVAGALTDAMAGLGPSGRISHSRLLSGNQTQRASISRTGSVCYSGGSGSVHGGPTPIRSPNLQTGSFGSNGSEAGGGLLSESMPSNISHGQGTNVTVLGQLLLPTGTSISSSNADGESNANAFLSVNCSLCRRRMSSTDHCTHCGGLIPVQNRQTALMQSTSFLSHSHRGSFSSEGSFDSGAAIFSQKPKNNETGND